MERKKVLALLLKLAFVLLAAVSAFAQQDGGRVVPVRFPQTLDAGRLRSGDPVHAVTLAPVRLADGMIVARGAEVRGRVVAAKRFQWNDADYAPQTPGVLRIHFDEIGGRAVKLTVRAAADALAADAARRPADLDLDPERATIQVGGDRVSPMRREVVSAAGEVVAYRRREGVYARMLASQRGAFVCKAVSSEVPVAMFSANACGAYGFNGLQVSAGDGWIAFASKERTPVLAKGAVALLEIEQ